VIRLSVNVNKVATLRNARGGALPSVRRAAETAIAAGCHGITVHPRPDERHIRRADVLELAIAPTSSTTSRAIRTRAGWRSSSGCGRRRRRWYPIRPEC
jgi:hypothetical protein